MMSMSVRVSLVCLVALGILGWASALGRAGAQKGGTSEETLPDGGKVRITRLSPDGEGAGAHRPLAEPPVATPPAGAAPPGTPPPAAGDVPPGTPPPAAGDVPPGTPPPAVPPVGEAGEEGEPQIDVGKYGVLIKERVTALKTTALTTITKKVRDKQSDRMQTVSDVLGWVAFGGVFLLLTPLFLRRRYPDKMGMMFKYSGLAAVTFFLAILLFTAVLVLLRETQSELGDQTNPQVVLIGAVFDNVIKYHKEFAQMGPELTEPLLVGLEKGDDSPLVGFVSQLGEIQKMVRQDVKVFETLTSWITSVNWIFGYVPVVLVLVAVLLFLFGIKDVVVDIVTLPARAAAGQVTRARSVIGEVLRKVGRELLATLCLILGIVLISLLAGFLLSRAMLPAVDALLAYMMGALFYLMTEPKASTGWIYVSIGGTLLFVVANIAVILVGYIFYVGKLQKILKQRFHDKVPLRRHLPFWGWGSLALLWMLCLPWLYMLAVRPFVRALMDHFAQTTPPQWVNLLVSGPAVLFLGFVVVFWAAQGVRAAGYLVKYNPKARVASPAPTREAAPAPGYAG